MILIELIKIIKIIKILNVINIVKTIIIIYLLNMIIILCIAAIFHILNILNIIHRCGQGHVIGSECNNIKKNIDLLIATDELCLDDLRSNVELNLLKNKELLKQDFVLIQPIHPV